MSPLSEFLPKYNKQVDKKAYKTNKVKFQNFLILCTIFER